MNKSLLIDNGAFLENIGLITILSGVYKRIDSGCKLRGRARLCIIYQGQYAFPYYLGYYHKYPNIRPIIISKFVWNDAKYKDGVLWLSPSKTSEQWKLITKNIPERYKKIFENTLT